MLCQWLACQLLRPAPKVKSYLVGGLYWEAALPVLLILLQASEVIPGGSFMHEKWTSGHLHQSSG